MAISVTNIGTGTGGSGTASISSVTLSAGVTVICGSVDGSSSLGGSVTDGTNTYSLIIQLGNNNNVSGSGFGSVFYSPNISAISGATLTYHATLGNANCGVSAAYATGLAAAPLDTAVNASNFGNSVSPTVTSGTPTVSGELFVGWVSSNGAPETFTQDTGHGWAFPLNDVHATNNVGGGGNQVNSGTGTKIYSPTISVGRQWADFTVGFVPATTASGDGSSAGSGAATATGASLLSGQGSAAGSGAATATGASFFAGAGSSAGTGTASTTGAAFFIASGSSAGSGTATSTSAFIFGVQGTAAGSGAATSTGASIFAGAGSAAGSGVASATGIMLEPAQGSSAGTGTAQAIGFSFFAVIGQSAGIGAGGGTGTAVTQATASAAGTGAASAVGAAFFASAGAASGAGTASSAGFWFQSTASLLFPTSDSSGGSWLNELGSGVNLFASIDEGSPLDTDYIKSSSNPSSDISSFNLSDPTGGIQQPFEISYRYRAEGSGSINLRVRLLQGATEIASWQHNAISTDFVTTTQVLTSPQFTAITDPTNLIVEFQASV